MPQSKRENTRKALEVYLLDRKILWLRVRGERNPEIRETLKLKIKLLNAAIRQARTFLG